MESLIRANNFCFFCSPISHTVSHDIQYGFLCKQCVELAQFCQAIIWFPSIVKVESAIMAFWILENWEVCQLRLLGGSARDSWEGNIVTLQSKCYIKLIISGLFKPLCTAGSKIISPQFVFSFIREWRVGFRRWGVEGGVNGEWRVGRGKGVTFPFILAQPRKTTSL